MAKMTKKQKAAAARRRNRMKGVNVLSLAEGYIQTSIWTEKLFRTNPYEFVTGITSGTYNPGSDGGSVISIPEMLGMRGGGNTGALGGSFGSYAADLPGAVARNITGKTASDPMQIVSGLVMPAVQTTLVGVGFKFGKK
jgi:hypothetical protein